MKSPLITGEYGMNNYANNMAPKSGLSGLCQQRLWTPRKERSASEWMKTERNATVYFDYFLNSHVVVKANLQHHLVWCLMFTEKNSK